MVVCSLSDYRAFEQRTLLNLGVFAAQNCLSGDASTRSPRNVFSWQLDVPSRLFGDPATLEKCALGDPVASSFKQQLDLPEMWHINKKVFGKEKKHAGKNKNSRERKKSYGKELNAQGKELISYGKLNEAL